MTGIPKQKQSLFFNDRYIESEGQLVDAIESANPVLYIHSMPAIPVFLKFGWILKSLNIFAFYPIRYLMYLSLDVYFICIIAQQILESELGCSIEEEHVHLLLNGQYVLDPDSSVYGCNIESGSVLEMALSNSTSIHKVFESMNRVGKKE